MILINWAYVSLKWEDILKADNNRRRQQQNRIVTYALLASSISLLVTLLFLSLCQNWSWVLVQLKVRSYKRSMYVLQDYQFKLAYDLLSRVEFRVVPLSLQGRYRVFLDRFLNYWKMLAHSYLKMKIGNIRFDLSF